MQRHGSSWQKVWGAQRLHYQGVQNGRPDDLAPISPSCRSSGRGRRILNEQTNRRPAVPRCPHRGCLLFRSESEVAERLRHVIEELRTTFRITWRGSRTGGSVEPLQLRAMLHQWKEVHYIGRKGGGFRRNTAKEATNVIASAVEPGRPRLRSGCWCISRIGRPIPTTDGA